MYVIGPIEHGNAVPTPHAVGSREGSSVGSAVGSCDGGEVGIADGEPVLGERLDGLMVVGMSVGAKVGNAVGAREWSSALSTAQEWVAKSEPASGCTTCHRAFNGSLQ